MDLGNLMAKGDEKSTLKFLPDKTNKLNNRKKKPVSKLITVITVTAGEYRLKISNTKSWDEKIEKCHKTSRKRKKNSLNFHAMPRFGLTYSLLISLSLG